MDILITIAALLVGVIGLDVAALLWGADSRETMADDHTR